MAASPPVASALTDLARGEGLELRVTGGCMAPGVPHGARITVRARPAYWPGDVVAWRRMDGRIHLHRLCGYLPLPGGIHCVTRGDGHRDADRPVPLGRVLGRLESVNGGAPRRVTLLDRAAALLRLPVLLSRMGLRAARRLRSAPATRAR